MRRTKWPVIGRRAFAYSKELDGYVEALADWVECQAIVKPAYGCDKVTLLSALKIGSWEPPTDEIKITYDAVAEDVFVTLADRSACYGKLGYPFDCDYAGRRLKFTGSDPWPYVALLALSYTNPKFKPRTDLPTGGNLLEQLAWVGIDRFIGQPAAELQAQAGCHHMGTPSMSGLPSRFCDKVDAIATQFNEGGKYQPWKSGHRQKSGDDGVDILLRRGFPDRRGAQFLLFGGCAGGENWSSTNHYEVDPDKWLDVNFTESFSGLRCMARCYVIPRQVGADGWLALSKAAGMIVDRCRLAMMTHKSNSPVLAITAKWAEATAGKAF